MIRLEDVAVAVKAQWDGSGLEIVVPGGLWKDRPSSPAATPYALLQIEDLGPEWTSGSLYLHRFRVTLSVWSTAGAVDAGHIRWRIDSAFNRDGKASVSVSGATRTVDLIPVPGASEPDPAQKEGQDVAITRSVFELTLQGTK